MVKLVLSSLEKGNRYQYFDKYNGCANITVVCNDPNPHDENWIGVVIHIDEVLCSYGSDPLIEGEEFHIGYRVVFNDMTNSGVTFSRMGSFILN